MMKLKSYIYALVASVAVLFSACSPEEYDLGVKDLTVDDLVEGLAYTITHDAENQNIVYLESKLGSSYTALWEHPQGRSQEKKITLKMPFDGTYTVKFGVETRGGVVYGEPATFTIDEFCADFVSGDLWTFLAGGSGNEKTWIPDNGKYGMKQGYYSCFDPSTTWVDMKQNDDNSYNWFADGKTWWEPQNSDVGITEDDLASYMTFSLKGKAGLTVHRMTDGAEEVLEGLFNLNTDNYTISAVDVDFLHGRWADGKALDFRTGFQVLVLTENQLMIGNLRDEALSGEGPCIFCWNFVSKEWADNYVPGEPEPDPEPTLPDGWLNDVSQTVSNSVKWVLSDKNPFDWANLDGSRMNGWLALEEYPDWSGFNASIPETYKKFSLTLNSDDHTAMYVSPDGIEESGSYTLDEKGIYTFEGIKPDFLICGNISLATSAENTWRITQIEKNSAGRVTGMWVGVRSTDKDEYIVYHLIPQVGGGSGEDEEPSVVFDNNKLVYGDIEGNGTLRIEILNIYGATGSDPGLDPNDIIFNNRLSVTFTLENVTLKGGAVGEYTAAICFANGDWSTQYWGGEGGDSIATGDGTYTVSFNGSSSSGISVFTVDVAGLANDIVELADVRVRIDKIELF